MSDTGKRDIRRYTIGDFATLVSATAKTLRYYDQIHLFRPASKDSRSGYRLYEPSQVRDWWRLIELRECGFSLKEIRELMRGTGAENAARARVREALRTELVSAGNKIAHLKLLSTASNGKHKIMFTRKQRRELIIISTRRRIETYGDAFDLRSELLAQVPQSMRGVTDGFVWHRCAGSGSLEVEPFVEIRFKHRHLDRLNVRCLPAASVISAFCENSDSAAEEAYAMVKGWLREGNGTLLSSPIEIEAAGALEIQFESKFQCEYASQ